MGSSAPFQRLLSNEVYLSDRGRSRLKRIRGLAMLAEKAMAPHSRTLAWKIPWTEVPGRLKSIGLLRVRHN